MLHSSDDRGIAGTSGFQANACGAKRICLRDETILLLPIATSASSLSCEEQGDGTSRLRSMSNWLAEEGSNMNAASSRCAAFLASRRECAWRIVWDR